MKVFYVFNAFLLASMVSASAMHPRQAAQPTIPAGAGPKCKDASGQNPSLQAGAGQGKQFATGCCLSDADCATGCCGFKTGICQAEAVAKSDAVGGCHGVFGAGAASGVAGGNTPAATGTPSRRDLEFEDDEEGMR